jgi:hypothetical protein
MLILVRSPAAEGHPSRWAVSGMGGSFRSVALGRSAVEGEPGRHVQVLLAPLRVHSRRRLRRPFLSSRAHEAPATNSQRARPPFRAASLFFVLSAGAGFEPACFLVQPLARLRHFESCLSAQGARRGAADEGSDAGLLSGAWRLVRDRGRRPLVFAATADGGWVGPVSMGEVALLGGLALSVLFAGRFPSCSLLD